VRVVAVGKAAAAMARAAEVALGPALGPSIAVGVGSMRPRTIPFVEAGHPLPDARGARAAAQALSLAGALRRSETLLVLLSGGASALLPAPAPGLRLADKVATTRLLLRAGADIVEVNAVRKHLSRVKGGGLARAAGPGRVLCLTLSDVVGDDLSAIGSGPTVPDPTTYGDAWAVLARHGLLAHVPAAVRRHLDAGRRGRRPETAKPGDPVFRRVRTEVVGSGAHALAAAERAARRLGFHTLVLTRRLGGEARVVGRVLGAILRECADSGRPVPAPLCLLAAGETTVTVRGRGRGGRNVELAIGAALEIDGLPGGLVLSVATDGVDGTSGSAGGVVSGSTLSKARELGLAPPHTFLEASDSAAFLAPVGGLLALGPTGTNVADIVLLLAGGPRRAARRL
jgi:glycerate 2-kinase